MLKLRPIIIFTALGLILSACTKQQPDPVETIPADRINKALARLIARWDHNNDGQATCADIAVLRRQQFSKLDLDGNHRLDQKEYRSVNFEDKSFVFHEFNKLDKDVSGMIELGEFVAVSHSEFRGLDKDNDCTLGNRDAAYSILDDRAQGLGGKRTGKPDDRSKRRKTEELDPFEG